MRPARIVSTIPLEHDPRLLFDLAHDICERPDIVAQNIRKSWRRFAKPSPVINNLWELRSLKAEVFR